MTSLNIAMSKSQGYSLAILLKTTIAFLCKLKYKYFQYLLISWFKATIMVILYIYDPSEMHCPPAVLSGRDSSRNHSICVEEETKPQR